MNIHYTSSFCLFQTQPVFILFFILFYIISQTTSWTHSPNLGPQYTTQEYIMSSNIMGSHGLCHYNKHDSFVHTGQQLVVWFGESGIYMCRVLPKLIPLWVAPLLLPYWRLITPWPARICSSEKFRTFFSASLGPMLGWPKLPAWQQKLRHIYSQGLLVLAVSRYNCIFHDKRWFAGENICNPFFQNTILCRINAITHLPTKRLQTDNNRIQILPFP